MDNEENLGVLPEPSALPEPSEDEIGEEHTDDAVSSSANAKKRKAQLCSKRVDGKRVRITNEQNAGISVSADHHAQSVRKDMLMWSGT